MKKRNSIVSQNLLNSAVLLASPSCLIWQDGLLFLQRSQDAKSKWYAPISLAMAYILQHGSMHLYVEDSIKQMHLSVWCCKQKTIPHVKHNGNVSRSQHNLFNYISRIWLLATLFKNELKEWGIVMKKASII